MISDYVTSKKMQLISPRKRVLIPPIGPRGRHTHLREEGGGRGPNSDDRTDTLVL